MYNTSNVVERCSWTWTGPTPHAIGGCSRERALRGLHTTPHPGGASDAGALPREVVTTYVRARTVYNYKSRSVYMHEPTRHSHIVIATTLHSHTHRTPYRVGVPARPDGRLAGDEERESRQIRCSRCDSAHGTPKNSDAAAALASLLGGPGGVSLVTSASCSRSSEPTSPTIVTLSRVTPLLSLSCEIWGDVGRCTEM